ncbi:VWA domain-containing protein [Parageobacillus thermoglucosidasius]|uniref:Cytosolic protein n=1 Tax=Parageobacillus thermoglucosidasius TaxID=1426 RepID=A0AAN0YRS9_PARTM|nr:VWA domain-containing protein [Parageobacillus thermoglucosidasius]ALF11691.1 cytosolic protein [Parageobacillus thermoglucosidasius]ANZ31774.1 cytosolic protein [Parageobacillus thermoglucosidasius]APM82509.1 cytosolic protein [Parageobacillus thermoglucosidasius]KJX69571.1 cytosolic protein [Parageobacillus thermoglucosidasius]RDE26249.1 VWA domain-containing protein [Parageobacillus thermoglucosidasius]
MAEKRKFLWLLMALLLCVAFGNVPAVAFGADNGSSTAALNFTITSSQTEYAKPPNADAQGRLDVTLTPQGRVDNIVRPPIDVVFVFDVSGSMTQMKLQSAKYALQSAVDYFKANANPNDRFALVPFSSDVQYNKVVPFPSGTYDVKQHLNWIATVANGLRANGGTNYTQALQQAQSFFNDPARKKYIIFLTDGMPTVSKVKEPITYTVCEGILFWRTCNQVTEDLDVQYILYSNGITAAQTIYYPDHPETETYSDREKYREFEEKIRLHGTNVAKTLGMNNITLYSIGFGNNQEVDMGYLEKLSSTAGGQAKQGTPQNLTEIFQQFSKLANDPVLSGTIKIPLTSFGGNVEIVETEQVWLDEKKENAYIAFTVPYKVGQPAPPPFTVSIPVRFKAKGEYTFTAELTYRDVYGVEQAPIMKSVKVVVKDEVPPSFDGTVTLEGITRDVNDLVKFGDADGDSNRFKARYSLTAIGYVGNASGNISNITLIQPLPDGITVVPSPNAPNVTVHTENGVQYAEIAFPNTVIDYKQLNNNEITGEITLQANWAMDGTMGKLPPAVVSFQDSKYGARTSSLKAPSQRIEMKVRLHESPDMYYEGDSYGLITKWQASAKLGETKHPRLPVKALQFKEDDVLLVTYNNDETVELYLKPRVAIETKDGQQIPSGATVTEQPIVKITGFVAGEGVTYEYKVENPKQDNAWKPLDSPYEIPVTWDGTSTISIKAAGGLTKGDGITTVSLTYIKRVRQLTLDYKQTMEVGETQTISVTIEPSDATNKTLQWISSNPDVAEVEDGKVTAKNPGTVKITVRAMDGSNVSATATIKVRNPYVPLEAINLPQIYVMNVGEKVDVSSILTFIPDNATNKNIRSVISNTPEYVSVEKEQGRWYIVAQEVGYSTITVTAEEKKQDDQDIQASMTVIVQENTTSPGESGKYRW